MSVASTFLWYDYETSGIDYRWDRPVQFACIRTNAELEESDESLTLYCQPPAESLPHPESVMITGITPQHAMKKGVPEYQFAQQLHEVFAQAGTCRVGYNNIAFDDQVTRYLFHRNFYPPYNSEWENGNSRWDVLNLVRACGAFRPEGIEWNIDAGGLPSYRLAMLSVANGIEHTDAHDAYADAYATLALARLIKERQPELFDYTLKLRTVDEVEKQLKLGQQVPVLHLSSLYGREHYSVGMLLPLVKHPKRNRRVLCVNLTTNPERLLDIDPAKLAKAIAENDWEIVSRCGVTFVDVNRCPFVAPLSVLNPEINERIRMPQERCLRNRDTLSAQWDEVCQKVSAAYEESEAWGSQSDPDPDDLYAHGLMNNENERLCKMVRESSPEALAEKTDVFNDTILSELLFRYRARNFPDSLSEAEQTRWSELRNRQLHEPPGSLLSWDSYLEHVSEMRRDPSIGDKQMQLLDELERWHHQMAPQQ